MAATELPLASSFQSSSPISITTPQNPPSPKLLSAKSPSTLLEEVVAGTGAVLLVDTTTSGTVEEEEGAISAFTPPLPETTEEIESELEATTTIADPIVEEGPEVVVVEESEEPEVIAEEESEEPEVGQAEVEEVEDCEVLPEAVTSIEELPEIVNAEQQELLAPTEATITESLVHSSPIIDGQCLTAVESESQAPQAEPNGEILNTFNDHLVNNSIFSGNAPTDTNMLIDTEDAVKSTGGCDLPFPFSESPAAATTFCAETLHTNNHHLPSIKITKKNFRVKSKNVEPLSQEQSQHHQDDTTTSEVVVTNRKSNRRRVARDVFFLFEEHPANKRRGRAKKSNKRNSHPKQLKPNRRINKHPKYEAVQTTTSPTLPTTTTFPSAGQDNSRPTAVATAKTEDSLIPRVNPIFLWVKQDQTRIVEVRCEDYDKRNRIKLTKTANGWRATPRTDPTTSRVVKLLPNPLIRLKQEAGNDPANSINNSSNNPYTCKDDYVNIMKIGKRKKKKKHKEKKAKREHHSQNHHHNNRDKSHPARSPTPVINHAAPEDVIIYENTNHERNLLPVMDEETAQPVASPRSPQKPQDESMDSIAAEMNNNRSSSNDDLSKTLNKLKDVIDLDLPFIPHMPNDKHLCEPIMSLCSQSEVFQIINGNGSGTQSRSGHFDSTENVCHDVDTKQLKDLLDDEDLLQHCDNAISGAEIIDSLVKRGCESNQISDDEIINQRHVKNSTNVSNDFDNEEDDILLEQEPVEDIISRLGESLAASPKCLSFNEAGEIEGLHGDLFQTGTQCNVFNQNSLDELSIAIKDFEKSSSAEKECCEKIDSETIVSPDSCLEDVPKDLTCKRPSNLTVQTQFQQAQCPADSRLRPSSISSDTIQSPQPSGLPAVLPSPGAKSKNIFLEQFGAAITPTVINKRQLTHQQKEPLDLGKHRKSASPTVTCSEEAKCTSQSILDNNVVVEPIEKKIKTENEIIANHHHHHHSQPENLLEMLASGLDPDPLTQLKMLVSNPEWKVPDPILVPKDRLSAVLASPAREIPLLLTTRPELRLPEAFACPSILTDPDILVISTAQLEKILQNQAEIANLKSQFISQMAKETASNHHQHHKNFAEKATPPTPTANNIQSLPPPFLPTGLAKEIDTATLAALNQMLWLPYIGKIAPEVFKSTLLAQQQQNNMVPNPLALQNPLELAMWQDALQQTQLQRNLKQANAMQREKVRANNAHNHKNARYQNEQSNRLLEEIKKLQQEAQNKFRTNSAATTNYHRGMMKQQQQDNKHIEASNFMSQALNDANFHGKKKDDQKPRVTCKSLMNLLQPERLVHQKDVKVSNLMARPLFDFNMAANSHYPQYPFGQDDGSLSQFDTRCQQQTQFQRNQASAAAAVAAAAAANATSSTGGGGASSSCNSTTGNGGKSQQMGKLKVKPGAHLLDPAAMQRRLINAEELTEVGSTTHGINDGSDLNSPLWHPLFGSAQNKCYTSPWQWTTVTAAGE